jgi:hypothetical protein
MGFGNYLAMILSLGSPLLLAKAHLFPSSFYNSFPDEAMPTALGVNFFLIRNGIIQRNEQIAGMLWLAGAVVLSQPFTISWQAFSLSSLWVDILGAVGAGVVVWLITMMLIKWRSARVYRPQIVKEYREVFKNQALIVTHDGRTPEQTAPPLSAEESRQRERMWAAQFLDRLGKAIDVPRKEHETDEQFVERLTPHFSSQSVDRQ